jgi:hypothetical protein
MRLLVFGETEKTDGIPFAPLCLCPVLFLPPLPPPLCRRPPLVGTAVLPRAPAIVLFGGIFAGLRLRCLRGFRARQPETRLLR